MHSLRNKRCLPCEGGVPKLSLEAAKAQIQHLSDGWQLNKDGTEIVGSFSFNDFHESMGFANAVAFVANTEGHHPVLSVAWASCEVRYWTHAIHGLSENDFICAAKIDALYEQYEAPPPVCAIA
ncbi:pterin-4-alpha-carbinolamine dehydratase [Magnetococcus marinus MC-1]|uniref:Putative pterin-4-alpha-carbinolamine dehydratase n=1 Tax=Magnetococcus marinus (strain ATCC BAA-1437 / JCM 17883 / MC-1) TaxID=156889 RepID=A0L9L9_MAGMM|nr:4a-hydroxytetrahydrobiopterin dehydratase [Magnetococcus marinus]ABK44662.1 pterin-4-alpha-carbinolamine dehydratase [Magnetococcus marinus MC-1]